LWWLPSGLSLEADAYYCTPLYNICKHSSQGTRAAGAAPQEAETDEGSALRLPRAPAARPVFPQDSATVAAGAGGTPTGSVTFKLFGPDNSTCDPNGASPVYTQAVSLANGSASTSNTTFSVSAASASTYKWLVVYDGDTTHDGATSACGTENFTLTIVNG